MSVPTKEKLAKVLGEAGLTKMAQAARSGHYDDFESDLAMPCVQLVQDLTAAGKEDLAKRAREGEWDGTREEADAWMQREGANLLFPGVIPGKP